jgi:hypothetical protein
MVERVFYQKIQGHRERLPNSQIISLHLRKSVVFKLVSLLSEHRLTRAVVSASKNEDLLSSRVSRFLGLMILPDIGRRFTPFSR